MCGWVLWTKIQYKRFDFSFIKGVIYKWWLSKIKGVRSQYNIKSFRNLKLIYIFSIIISIYIISDSIYIIGRVIGNEVMIINKKRRKCKKVYFEIRFYIYIIKSRSINSVGYIKTLLFFLFCQPILIR